MMNYQEGITDASGIVGLAAGFNGKSGPLLIPALYQNGVISKPIFSIYIGEANQNSYLDIG